MRSFSTRSGARSVGDVTENVTVTAECSLCGQAFKATGDDEERLRDAVQIQLLRHHRATHPQRYRDSRES